MFAQSTRISNDHNQVLSYEKQVDRQSEYLFSNRLEDACENTTIYDFHCRQNQVGDRQINASNQLRGQPTSLNEPGQRKMSRMQIAEVPYKVGGGYEGRAEMDVSRDFISAPTDGKYGQKYYKPYVNFWNYHDCSEQMPVEEFVRGGLSTRACYRNAKKKMSPNGNNATSGVV